MLRPVNLFLFDVENEIKRNLGQWSTMNVDELTWRLENTVSQ